MTDSHGEGFRPQGLLTTWPRRITFASLVLAVAVAVVVTLVVRGYEPLRATDAWFPDGWTLEERPEGIVMTAPYAHGESIRHGFSLRNDGRWGVTVTRIEADRGLILARLSEVLVQQDPNLAGGDGGTLTPFEPFGLASGDERFLVFERVFGDCDSYLPGSGNTTVSMSVRYTIAGFEKSMSVALPQPIHVTSPAEGCPQRA